MYYCYKVTKKIEILKNTWFSDYKFYVLGGEEAKTSGKKRNLFATKREKTLMKSFKNCEFGKEWCWWFKD